MTAGVRPVDSLIGVYNADGGIVGELRYVTGKIFGRAHCALCDITHRGVTPRKEWSQACDRIAVPFQLLHLNERPEDIRRASDGTVPCVAGQLANMIDVIGDRFERHTRTLGLRVASHPSWHEHPGVESRADDRVAGDQFANLLVGELAIVRHESATV